MANLDSEPATPAAGAFSELEEAFFRDGDAMSAEAETGHAAAFAQSRSRQVAEPAAPEDDDWDWKIALARSRPATQPG